MIEIKTDVVQDIAIVKVAGEIDAASAPKVQKQVLPLVKPGAKMILDMTALAYMSSAGLRMLLSVYRQTINAKAQIILVGISEELRDTMAMTGFLGYFTIHPTLQAGIQALSG